MAAFHFLDPAEIEEALGDRGPERTGDVRAALDGVGAGVQGAAMVMRLVGDKALNSVARHHDTYHTWGHHRTSDRAAAQKKSVLATLPEV